MKTSFYFVIWIAIYPILDLLGISPSYSFFIALIAIAFLSSRLNKAMKNIITYDRTIQAVEICEKAYNADLQSINKKISTIFTLNLISLIYFITISAYLLKTIISGVSSEIITLLIFLFFTFTNGYTLNTTIRAKQYMRNTTSDPEALNKALQLVFHVNYTEYCRKHIQTTGPSPILPPRPHHYTTYLATSLIIAIICIILGTATLIIGFILTISATTATQLNGTIMLLYGALAIYYGIYDTITTLRAQRLPGQPK